MTEMPARRHFFTLRLKLALTLLLPLLVTSVITSYLRYVSYRRILVENLQLSAGRSLGAIAESVREAFLADDLMTLQQTAEALLERGDLSSVTVQDDRGRTLLSLGEHLFDAPPSKESWDRLDVNGPVGLPSGSEVLSMADGSRVYLAQSEVVDLEGKGSSSLGQVGRVVLIAGFPLALLDAQLSSYRQSRMILTLGSILVILLMADLMMSRVVITRLGQILRGAWAVGAGNLETQMPVAHRDEITELTEAFGWFSQKLTERASLEQMVRERTDQLQLQAESLAMLNSLAAAVSQSLDLRHVLDVALQEVLRLMDLRGGWILLCDGSEHDLGPTVSHGLPDGVVLAQTQCSWSRSWQREVLQHGRARVFPYAPEHPCPAAEHFDEAGTVALAGNVPNPCAAAQYLHHAGLAFRACVPLTSRDRLVGVMSLVGEPEQSAGGVGVETTEMLTAVGRQIGVAVENARLYDELQREATLRRQVLDHLITAQEEERKRIARELHDQTSQSLTSLIITLKVLEEAGSLEEVRTHVGDLRATVGRILKEVHEMGMALRPRILDDLGLLAALRQYVADLQYRLRLPIDLQVLGLEGERLRAPVETALYRIAQEALANVAMHAQAQSVSVLLEKRGHLVKLIVEDDGHGFDVDQVTGGGPYEGNLGLHGMRERVSLLGGTLTIESRPGTGTAVFVEIPLGR